MVPFENIQNIWVHYTYPFSCFQIFFPSVLCADKLLRVDLWNVWFMFDWQFIFLFIFTSQN